MASTSRAPMRKQPSRGSNVQPQAQASSSSTALHSHNYDRRDDEINRVNESQSTNTRYKSRYDNMSEFAIRRLKRRLEDLERINPTDIPSSSFIPIPSSQNHPHSPNPLSLTSTSSNTPSFAHQQQQQKRKQSGNVRRILYARKSLKDWLDELPPSPMPPYLSAVAPPPITPPRKICSSCGYIGSYVCPRCSEWSCDRLCLEVHQRDGGCGVA